MYTVWVFLILTNGHMIEVGKFKDEATCEATRKEVIVQRNSIGYELTKHFEPTKCFQVWK